jgi:tetratricopeptide (TPR) repeat protein
MPALGIVEEVAGGLGVVLWRCARDVVLWASTPAARRSGLFTGTAAERRTRQLEALSIDPELAAPLAVMARMLESPAAIPERLLVNACRRLALWAEQQGHLATALEFMQAGALVAPESAALAYAVGRLARRRAEYDRAESWYVRGIVQARRAEDHRVYARSYAGLGTLYLQRGNLPAARRAFLRCLKAASRHGHADLQGTAYHDLFLTELETGAGPECEVLAENALAAFGSNSGAIARLAFDVAYHWILLGRFAAALRVAQALSPYFDGASEQALVLSMTARSAGGVGDRATFSRAAERLNALLQSGAGADSAPRALLGLAYGAASLADWQAALGFVQGAIEAARERSEGKILIMAEAALDSIQRHAALDERGAPAAGVSSLAERFVDALAAPAPAGVAAV